MTALQRVHERMRSCMNCPLGRPESETFHRVPGEGPEDARVMIVGEAPGAEEERTGRPFVGRSGNLLTEILTAAGFDRTQIFVTSVCKCRPPQNRTPKRPEMAACLPWLHEQIGLIRPEVLLTVGNVGTQTLLSVKTGINALRGRFHELSLGGRTMLLRPLFHPAYLLRNPRRGPGTPWNLMLADLIEVRQLLERASR